MSKSMLQRFMPNSPLQVLCGNLVIGFIFTLQSVTDAQLNPQGAYQNPRSPNWNSQTPFTPPQNLLENRQGQRLMHHNSSPTQGQQGRSPRIQPSNFGKFDNSSGYAPASSTRYLNRQNTSTRTATANDNNSLTRQFRSYQINQANSSNVTKQLQQQLGDMVEIVNDPTHNRIVVNATDSNHRMVKQFIDRMESPQTRPAALSKSKSIRSFNVSVEMLRNAANQLSQLYVDQNRIIVAADETAGKLLVFSTEPDYQEVTTYLRRNGYLDTRKPFDPGKPGVQYHQLKNVGWRELETAIFRGWGNTLKIEVSQDGNFSRIQIPTLDQRQSNIQIDRRNNQVQIESSGLQLTGITNLIHLLDQPAGTGKLEIIKTNPEAIDQVQSTVSMFKFAALQQDVQPKTTSAIIGKAKRNGVYAIYQDQATPEDADPNQDPTTQENTEETLGPIGRVEIITIPGTDIIILKGDPKDVERVRTLIQQIEKTSEEYKPVIEVLPLNHVDNIAVQVIADEVYTNFYEPSLGETSITALVKPNALLLVGTPQGVTQAREIVEKLDVEVEAKTEFKVFRIKHMSAVDLENRLRSFYLGQSTTGFGANGGGNQNNAAQGFGGEGLATRMRLASDYRSNTLFVHASRRDMDEITKFIAEIDVESTGEGNEDHLKIIRLKNSTASELAPILQDILTGQLQGAGQSTTGNNNNQNNQFNNQNNQQFSQVRSAMLALRSLDPSGKIVRSSILFDTRVTSDENSNSLIIKAPPGSMELIELLVNQLDQLPDVESQIKVFELENASSPQVVETIQNLFEAQQGGGGNNAGGTNIIPLETGGFDSTIVSLRLAADARSNTVIAAGSQGDLNIIEALVTRLDEDIESKYIHKIFRLQNVTADVVEEALTGWLTGRSDTLSADPRIIGSGDGSLESVKRAITIQAETETNSLIVSAHKEYIHIIETMIRDIDFKKQVVIQAVIAEVQLSDTFEFGIEWGVQDSLVFDRGLGDGIGYPFNSSALGNTITAGTPGLLSREDLAGQVLQNLNVGRSNTGLGYGGLVMSAGNESINVLLRALDDKSKVDILSRPQITTMENIQAFVQVGQDLPYVTGVDNSNTAGGNTTFATDFLELGVTLSVTPRVRPDGEIWMRVDVSNSSVADGDGVAIQTTASGGVVFQPIINDQTLQTDVSAHSGQTIVLGGLIQSVTQDVVRGIPFFSD
ncbi:MAG: secretin N-terminal domain-containing protein, partial [Planctomycetota bacterium]|nr:secretin N-terminal domain-containing protein [Planctomycetota bacterium]